MDYSPLLAGFSIVLKDGRAAFLTSSNLKFDPNVSFNYLNLICYNFFLKFTASNRNMGSRAGRCDLYYY
jgi:hypothetical protein